jgi:hypothetical protein
MLVWTPAWADTTAPARWMPKDGERLVFDVYRNGSKFGQHIVSFTRKGDALDVKTDIEFRVKVGPVTAFHYVHQSQETWTGAQIKTVRARTKSKGVWREMALDAVDGGLKVAGSAFRGVVPKSLVPSSHWDIRQMKQSEMLSTETGALLPMKVADRGVSAVKTASGTIEARRYDVDSELDASFWYDGSGRWVKCAFETDGQKIEYVLNEGA